WEIVGDCGRLAPSARWARACVQQPGSSGSDATDARARLQARSASSDAVRGVPVQRRRQGPGHRASGLPRLRRGRHGPDARHGRLLVRVPHGRLATDRDAPHRTAPHRPRRAQLRALLLLRRFQGQARLGGAHHHPSPLAHLRQGGGQRRGGGRPEPAGDLERRPVAIEPRRRAGATTGARAAARAARMSAATSLPHAPVMAAEVLEYLAPRPGGWYVDATFGAGGHTRALLRRGANVIAIDQDPGAATYAAELAREIGTLPASAGAAPRLVFAAGNFRQMESIVFEHGVDAVAGVLLDLGVSSMQLDEGERGFAFRHEGPLDMRMGYQDVSAA